MANSPSQSPSSKLTPTGRSNLTTTPPSGPTSTTNKVCSKATISSGTPQYTKQECSHLGVEDNIKLMEKATTGTSTKIHGMDYKKIGPRKEITLKQIPNTISWLQTYLDSGSEAYIEDLEQILAYLLNSMHADLEQCINTTMSFKYFSNQHRGPLTFAIMIDMVINLSECAIKSMHVSIKNYKISTVPGKNIEIVCHCFCYVLKRLKNNNSLSLELQSALFKVFQTTSVPEFNSLISQWKKS
eukprot:2976723-Ditylum_brightwellii.AAC.1